MILRVGTVLLGKVDELNGQWIETKFFMFGVPLFPTSSFWVTSGELLGNRAGFGIPLYSKSIIAGYARIYAFFAAAILLILGFANHDSTAIYWGLILAASWVYFMFLFGRSQSSENVSRLKLGNIIGLYALPQWLDYDHTYGIYERLERRYKETFSNDDWMNDLLSVHIAEDKLPYLYTLAALNYGLGPNFENKELLKKADHLYQPVTTTTTIKIEGVY